MAITFRRRTEIKAISEKSLTLYQIIHYMDFMIKVIRIKGNKQIYCGYDILHAYLSIINDLGGQVESVDN